MLAFALGVTSLAVVASRSDGLPKLPVLAAGAADREASTASTLAPMAAGLWAPYPAVRYEAGPGLKAPGGKVAAYRLRGGSDSDVARLAKALGFGGPVRRTDGGRVVESGGFALHVQDGPGNPWYIGPDCESGAGREALAAVCGMAAGGVVSVDAAVSSPAAGSGSSGSSGSSAGRDPGTAPPTTATTGPDAPGSVGGCKPCPPGAMCTAVCLPPDEVVDPPKRPAGLPSEADAEAKAKDLFSAIGLDLSGAVIETYDEFSAWRVQVAPLVKGVRTVGMETSLAIGVGGRVVGGNGFLGQPERMGAYPLVGVAETIRRLNGEGPGAMGGGGVPMGRPGPMAGGPAVDLPAQAPATEIATPVAGLPVPIGGSPTTIPPCGSLPPNSGMTPIAPTCDPPPCGPAEDCATRPVPEPAPVPAEPEVITVTSLRLVLQLLDGVLVPAFEALATVEGSTEPKVTGQVPAIPEQHFAQPKPAPLPEPAPSTVEPVPAPIEPVPAERPVQDAMKTALEQDFDSGVSGWAVTQRRGPTSWDVEVHASALRPSASYSVLIGRPRPDGGTPFPTVCSFTSGPDGNGSCTGRIELPEGAGPTTVSLMGPDGRSVAHGRFT